jgi:hypothetical protein
MANFAFVVENDVFHVAYMDEKNHPTAERWAAGLRSNPTFVNVDEYQFVGVGWKFKNKKFYDQEDIEYTEKYDKQIKDSSNKSLVFVGIVGEEIFGRMSFPSPDFSDEFLEMINIAMNSNVKIIEYPDKDIVKIGYKWNGENFYE